MTKKIFVSFVLIVSIGIFGFVTASISKDQENAGTLFGDSVFKGNYNFVLKVVLSFNSPWGSIPNSREQLQKRIWDDLLLSYEANRRQITVEREELEAKISETLKGNKVSFNWKEDPKAYAKWVRATLGESVEVFESQIRHLVQTKKLYTKILDDADSPVTEEEAFQEFQNEYNNLSVEIAEFKELNEAQDFYQKAIEDPLFWQQAADRDKEKEKEGRLFRRPGFVALEFLMDMWKLPKDAVYGMIDMKAGDIYPPAPVAEGYAVFKVLDIRHADATQFPKRRESFFRQLRRKKKHQGFIVWLEKLKNQSDMQIYLEPPPELFP